MPAPPTRPAAKLSTMLPYKFGITQTSNCCGLDTNCMQQLSMIILSNWKEKSVKAVNSSKFRTHLKFLSLIEI
uniref:Uncharacterized protein n=1 Tax=Romanomermis culicivorax TaxID=13658 RepID=A0A915IEU6_ROMCU